jgi:hypothetical protein
MHELYPILHRLARWLGPFAANFAAAAAWQTPGPLLRQRAAELPRASRDRATG